MTSTTHHLRHTKKEEPPLRSLGITVSIHPIIFFPCKLPVKTQYAPWRLLRAEPSPSSDYPGTIPWPLRSTSGAPSTAEDWARRVRGGFSWEAWAALTPPAWLSTCLAPTATRARTWSSSSCTVAARPSAWRLKLFWHTVPALPSLANSPVAPS